MGSIFWSAAASTASRDQALPRYGRLLSHGKTHDFYFCFCFYFHLQANLLFCPRLNEPFSSLPSQPLLPSYTHSTQLLFSESRHSLPLLLCFWCHPKDHGFRLSFLSCACCYCCYRCFPAPASHLAISLTCQVMNRSDFSKIFS